MNDAAAVLQAAAAERRADLNGNTNVSIDPMGL
jgi:hypothetical protein